MAKPKPVAEHPENALRHCLTETPYRMVVFKRCNGNTPLYLVAGSNTGEMGAEKALKRAYELHGGSCFYCKQNGPKGQLTIEHADAKAHGGKSDIQNLLLACRSCNLAKASKPIEFFHPAAGREWLSAVLAQVQERLNRL